jgi:hypothetical protein
VVNAGTIVGAGLPASGAKGTDVRAALLGLLPTGVGINPGTRNRTDVDPSFHNPYTENWTFGIQRQITNAVAFESRYVGNHTVGNFQTINANPQLCTGRSASGTGLCATGGTGTARGLAQTFPNFMPPGVTPCNLVGTPGFASGRADCAFTNVRRRANTAFSIYHGIQNELRIRNFHGLSAGLTYTFSKTMDNVSEIFSTFSGATTVAGSQDPFVSGGDERSLSGLDFRHVATLYFTYELPWYKNQSGALGHVLGGWQVSPTWRYNTGQNYTPAQLGGLIGLNHNCQTSFSGAFFGSVDTCRPFLGNSGAPVDKVGLCTDAAAPDCGIIDFDTGDPTSMSAVRWIYNDDVAAQFFGTPYGNVRRNPGIRGQATNTVAMNVLKNIKVTDKVYLRFEAQAFNLFNHQFLGVPDPVMEDCRFESIEGGVPGCSGSFGNNFFNNNGGDYSQPTINSIGRRRLVFGLKVIF